VSRNGSTAVKKAPGPAKAPAPDVTLDLTNEEALEIEVILARSGAFTERAKAAEEMYQLTLSLIAAESAPTRARERELFRRIGERLGVDINEPPKKVDVAAKTITVSTKE